MGNNLFFEINGKEENVRNQQISLFQQEVLKLVEAGNLYIDSITECCDKFNIEIESIKDLISPFLVEKLYEESVKRKTVKGTDSFQLDFV